MGLVDAISRYPAPAYRSTLIRLLVFVLVANIAVNLGDCISIVYTKKFNVDEFQHTHIIWNIVQGKILYKDFFDHHGLLFPYLTSLFFSGLHYQPSIDTLYFLRLQSLLFTALILLFTFLITQFLTQSNLWGLLAVSLLSSLDFFKITAIEIRPDTLQNVFLLYGMYVFLKCYERRSPIRFFMCGVCLGLSVLVNAKALLGIAALGIFMMSDASAKKDLAGFVRRMPVFLAGGAAPLLVACFYCWCKGSLSAYLYYNFYFNIRALPLIYQSNLPYMHDMFFGQTAFFIMLVLGMCALLYTAYKACAAKQYDGKLLFILIMTFATSSLLYRGCFWLYVFISVMPIMCIGAIYGLHAYGKQKQKFFAAGGGIIAGLFVLAVFSKHLLFSAYQLQYAHKDSQLLAQEASIAYVLQTTPRSESILFIWNDGGNFVFNEDVQYYWYSIEGFQQLIDEKEHRHLLGDDLIRLIEAKHLRYISAKDGYDMNLLPDATRKYILSHYKYTNFYALLERI